MVNESRGVTIGSISASRARLPESSHDHFRVSLSDGLLLLSGP
jgi:hypothetical protein